MCFHAGITLGEDGATHQILEDIGLMKMLPGMTVINPCDFNQTKAATIAIAAHEGPVYLRFGRPKVPNFTPKTKPLKLEKAIVCVKAKTLPLRYGHLVWEALEATVALEVQGVSAEVINIHTIKPLDKEIILESAAKTGAVVTAEEHNYLGGLGKVLLGYLLQTIPVHKLCGNQRYIWRIWNASPIDEKYQLDREAITLKRSK